MGRVGVWVGRAGVWVGSGRVGGEFGWSVGVVGGNMRLKCRIVVRVFM